jgi:hypothetical protein
MNYQDIYVVDSFEEAEQFRYNDTGESVEVGTAVAYDVYKDRDHQAGVEVVLTCFEGIHFTDEC